MECQMRDRSQTSASLRSELVYKIIIFPLFEYAVNYKHLLKDYNVLKIQRVYELLWKGEHYLID